MTAIIAVTLAAIYVIAGMYVLVGIDDQTNRLFSRSLWGQKACLSIPSILLWPVTACVIWWCYANRVRGRYS